MKTEMNLTGKWKENWDIWFLYFLIFSLIGFVYVWSKAAMMRFFRRAISHILRKPLREMPTESSRIQAMFGELIEANGLPKVVFHSLRHTSITYKLKLNGGDIKAVQGDSGHAQASMVTDQNSHILDDDRQKNAELFERAFYSGREKKRP